MYHPVGNRIKGMREFRGLTQGQLSYKAATTVSQISRLENDERPGAQAAIVARVASALDTTVDYLLGLTDDPGIPEDGNTASPEARAMGLELQRIWRDVEEADPDAARELMRIAIVQAAAFRAAVNAAKKRIEESAEQEARCTTSTPSTTPHGGSH